MDSELEYKALYSEHRYGSLGQLGVKIMVGGTNLPDLKDPDIQAAAYDAVKAIVAEVTAKAIANNPDERLKAEEQRKWLLECFTPVGKILVEAIPNGYCSDYRCRHLPWFVVTTAIGRITIGWRKRVISIDWSDSEAAQYVNTEELFADEQTTKLDHGIHAWSYAKAREYISKVVAHTLNCQQYGTSNT